MKEGIKKEQRQELLTNLLEFCLRCPENGNGHKKCPICPIPATYDIIKNAPTA